MNKLNFSIFVVTLSVIVYVLNRSWGELQDHRIFDLAYFSLILLVQFLFLLITVSRTQLVMNAFSNNCIGYLKWLKLFLEGRIINNIAPQRGNVYRGVIMKREILLPYTAYVASQFFYTWIDIVINLVLSALLLFVFFELQGKYLSIFYVLLFMSFLCFFFPLLYKYSERISVPRWLLSPTVFFRNSFSLIGARVSSELVLKLIVLGIFSAVFFIGRIYIGFLVFGENLSLQDLIVFFALLKLSSVMLITPGNVGVQELSMGLMSEFLGYGMAIGVAVMLTLRIYEYILYLLTWLVVTPMVAIR